MNNLELHIRPFEAADKEAIWGIIKEVISTGDTYVFDPNSERNKMIAYWTGTDKHCYVAQIEGKIVGTYIMKDNQPDLGNHIANASYMVHPAAHGNGIGRKMAENSILEAKRLGYEAMQFNIVVKVNEGAIALWKKLGFSIIGQIPNAFRHAELGKVDAYIMYKDLID